MQLTHSMVRTTARLHSTAFTRFSRYGIEWGEKEQDAHVCGLARMAGCQTTVAAARALAGISSSTVTMRSRSCPATAMYISQLYQLNRCC
jgi:hypothetical protein